MPLPSIIQISELIALRGNPELMLFDVSTGKNARENYTKEHLEGAQFVDLNTQLADIKDNAAHGGRHPLPELAVFARTLSDLGISENTHVVIYDDSNGANAAARFWWMLRAVGHKKVQVLNGGLHAAKAQSFPTESGIYHATPLPEMYPVTGWKLPTVTMSIVESVSQNPDYIVVDVRSRERFEGIHEPIDLIAGHIPGAINIPFTENLDTHGQFLSQLALQEHYSKIFGNTVAQHIIVHCGSGVTACHTLLALDYAGLDMPNLYIGSWSEWSRNDKEMITGEAL